MKIKISIHKKMKRLMTCYAGFQLLTIPIHAQLKLNYANFLIPPDIIYSYQEASGGVSVPPSGVNQIWDYSTLVNTANIINDPYIPETNPVFSTARRQRLFHANFGAGFSPMGYEHSKANSAAYTITGLTFKRAAYSLGSVTGNNNDSIIVLPQNIQYGGNKLAIPFPLTYLKSWTYTYNYNVSLQISLASEGLNHAPLKFSSGIVCNNNVTGWGDMRIPTVAGASNYISCLQLKTSKTQVDSFFVNGAPANTSVLNVLGFIQGQTTHQYLHRFKRAGIEQDLITFYFTDSSFNVVDRVIYDRKYFDIYCIDNCYAKMCLNGNSNVCFPYSNNSANNAMLLNGASLGACEPNRFAEENYSENIARIYPNPAENKFTLILIDGDEPASVVIYDLTGKKREQYDDVIQWIEFGDDFAPGIYYAHIQKGDQKQIIKMVKGD